MAAKVEAPFRASVIRLTAVARLLRTGEPFDAVTASAELGTVTRTIKRDIQILRSLGWHIKWDTRERSYVLNYAPKAVLI
jgi:hypothetical protein